MSGYFSELTRNWRPLLAAFIGMGSGMSVVGYITSTIVPSLISDAGWNTADFAKVGGLAIFMAGVFPFIGRLTDVVGVRKAALIGQVTLPLCYLAYSRMDGDLTTYKLIFIVQSLLCVTTTQTVYSRLAVQYVEKARGLALAIVVSGSALSGMLLTWFFNLYVEANGWRDAYVAAAVFTAVAGLITFLLIPANAAPTANASSPKRKASQDYPAIFSAPAFWVLFGAMALCNLPQTLLLVQLKALMIDNGLDGKNVGIMLMAAPFGMLIGRFAAGMALDRYRPHLVAFVTLALPSFGLFLIASSFNSPAVLTFSVFCVGFAFGAEGDILAFLVARTFGVSIYSSVMGLLTAVSSISTASGAWILGWTLDANAVGTTSGAFNAFLWIAGTAVLIGAALLLTFGRLQRRQVP